MLSTSDKLRIYRAIFAAQGELSQGLLALHEVTTKQFLEFCEVEGASHFLGSQITNAECSNFLDESERTAIREKYLQVNAQQLRLEGIIAELQEACHSNSLRDFAFCNLIFAHKVIGLPAPIDRGPTITLLIGKQVSSFLLHKILRSRGFRCENLFSVCIPLLGLSHSVTYTRKTIRLEVSHTLGPITIPPQAFYSLSNSHEAQEIRVKVLSREYVFAELLTDFLIPDGRQLDANDLFGLYYFLIRSENDTDWIEFFRNAALASHAKEMKEILLAFVSLFEIQSQVPQFLRQATISGKEWSPSKKALHRSLKRKFFEDEHSLF